MQPQPAAAAQPAVDKPKRCPYCKALVRDVPESQAHPNGIAPLRGRGCEFCDSQLNSVECRCGGSISQSSGECNSCDDADAVL